MLNTVAACTYPAALERVATVLGLVEWAESSAGMSMLSGSASGGTNPLCLADIALALVLVLSSNSSGTKIGLLW